MKRNQLAAAILASQEADEDLARSLSRLRQGLDDLQQYYSAAIRARHASDRVAYLHRAERASRS